MKSAFQTLKSKSKQSPTLNPKAKKKKASSKIRDPPDLQYLSHIASTLMISTTTEDTIKDTIIEDTNTVEVGMTITEGMIDTESLITAEITEGTTSQVIIERGHMIGKTTRNNY